MIKSTKPIAAFLRTNAQTDSKVCVSMDTSGKFRPDWENLSANCTMVGCVAEMMASPVLLAVMNSNGAFHVITLHNLAIALAVVPSQMNDINFKFC
ncbi:hypothetical protein OAJ84_00240 [Candidatus Puniceispirillum sp.]|nr:hypothetical protein [Candidatus Puniceispirillum sp.]